MITAGDEYKGEVIKAQGGGAHPPHGWVHPLKIALQESPLCSHLLPLAPERLRGTQLGYFRTLNWTVKGNIDTTRRVVTGREKCFICGLTTQILLSDSCVFVLSGLSV